MTNEKPTEKCEESASRRTARKNAWRHLMGRVQFLFVMFAVAFTALTATYVLYLLVYGNDDRAVRAFVRHEVPKWYGAGNAPDMDLEQPLPSFRSMSGTTPRQADDVRRQTGRFVAFFICLKGFDTGVVNLCFLILVVGWFVYIPLLEITTIEDRIQRKDALANVLHCAMKSKVVMSEAIRRFAADQYASASVFYTRKLRRFAAALESGTPFAAAVVKFRALLPAGFVELAPLHDDSNEACDLLDDVRTSYDAGSETRQTTRCRFYYLLFVFWILLAQMCFVYILLLPVYREIFADYGDELPLITTLFEFGGSLVVQYWYLVVFPALAALVWLCRIYDGHLNPPSIFRRFWRDRDAARFLRLTAAGIVRNVPLPRIVGTCAKNADYRYKRRRAAKILAAIEAGSPWLLALTKYRAIGRREADVLEAAQRTGNLASALRELAAARDAKQERRNDLTSKLLFSATVFFWGVFVGLIAIAFQLPLYTLITSLVK